MILRLVQTVTIMLYAMVAGVLWGTWLSLGKTMTEYDATTFLADGQHMIANLAPVMPVLMISAAVGTLAILLLLPRPKPRAALWLTILALVLLIAVIAITLAVEVPIDNKVKVWTVATLPSDWADIRARWATFHTVRTFVSLAGLLCVVAGAVTLVGRPLGARREG
jgi:uncharacterized membrane protein